MSLSLFLLTELKPAECRDLHDTSESAECELHDTSVDVDELAKAPSLGER